MRKMGKHERTLAIALEAVGSCVVLVGIAIEVATGAAVGHIIITSGCLFAMLGAMMYVKLFRKP